MKTLLVCKNPRRSSRYVSVKTSLPFFRPLVLETAAAGSNTGGAAPQYNGGTGHDVDGGRCPERVQVTRGVAVLVHVTWILGPVIVVTVDPNVTCDEPGEQEAAKQAVTDAGEDPRTVLLLLPLSVPALGKLTEDPEHIVDDSHGPGHNQIDRDEPLQGTLVSVKGTNDNVSYRDGQNHHKTDGTAH